MAWGPEAVFLLPLAAVAALDLPEDRQQERRLRVAAILEGPADKVRHGNPSFFCRNRSSGHRCWKSRSGSRGWLMELKAPFRKVWFEYLLEDIFP